MNDVLLIFISFLFTILAGITIFLVSKWISTSFWFWYRFINKSIHKNEQKDGLWTDYKWMFNEAWLLRDYNYKKIVKYGKRRFKNEHLFLWEVIFYIEEVEKNQDKKRKNKNFYHILHDISFKSPYSQYDFHERRILSYIHSKVKVMNYFEEWVKKITMKNDIKQYDKEINEILQNDKEWKLIKLGLKPASIFQESPDISFLLGVDPREKVKIKAEQQFVDPRVTAQINASAPFIKWGFEKRKDSSKEYRQTESFLKWEEDIWKKEKQAIIKVISQVPDQKIKEWEIKVKAEIDKKISEIPQEKIKSYEARKKQLEEYVASGQWMKKCSVCQKPFQNIWQFKNIFYCPKHLKDVYKSNKNSTNE